MALSAGTVSITANATTGAPSYTGSGLALLMAQNLIGQMITDGALPAVPAVGSTSSPFSVARPATASDVTDFVNARQAIYNDEARRANQYAAAVVSHITGNANVTPGSLSAHVTTQQLGVTTTTGVAINAPSSPVDVPVTGLGLIT